MPVRRLSSRCPAAPLLVATLLAAPVAAAGQSEPMDLSHLRLLRRVSSPEVSADGRRVAYVVETPAPGGESVVSEVKVLSLADGKVVTVCEGSRPRFSPDGRRLAYLAEAPTGDGKAPAGNGQSAAGEAASAAGKAEAPAGSGGAVAGPGEAAAGDAEKETALFVYDLEAGKSERLVTVHASDHFLGHEAERGFAWSPDGKAIAFLGAEGPPPPAGGVKVISRLLYKTRTGFSDGRRTHLWVVPAEGEERGQPRLLTPGGHDEHSLAWSPDGRALAFVSNRAPDPDDHYADDLFVVGIGGGEARRLTDTAGTEMHPDFSPDGRSIAYLATRRPTNTRDSPAEDPRLLVIPAAGGTPAEPAPGLDLRLDELTWLPDGKSLFVLAQDRGRTPILRVSIPSPEGGAAAKVERFFEGYFRASSLSLDAAGRMLVYLRSGFVSPAEVFSVQVANKAGRGITFENRRLLARVEFRDADSFWSTAADGTRSQGWVVRPAGFRPGVRYPAVLWVHGGPHGMFGYGFSERVQLLAGRGYGVILVNPRGSTGYGQAFADGTLGAWGGGDYQDLMAGVDQALAKFPWLDGGRLGVGGTSYGGYMTNWIVTQTDRFKAAVAIAGLSNLVSFYGTTLYQDLIEVEYGGRPWEGENFAHLWQASPLAHVAQAKTPALLLHGEADHDVPITQAEEMYMALRKRGVEALLVRYPEEGHGLRKPNHARDASKRTLAWFDRFLKGEPPAAAPREAPPGEPPQRPF